MPQHLLSDANRPELRVGERSGAFGQNYHPTMVDRFGVWLSARQIRNSVDTLHNKTVGDIGCGYHATFIRSVLPVLKRAVLIDSAIADDLKSGHNVMAIEGVIPEALHQVPTDSLDVVLCISVLEHLWDPEAAIRECYRIVRHGGLCMINVPSWRGKWFLEFSAFRLGLSPADEIRDHKTYYNVKDLHPLLLQAGFRPDNIRCFSHKFGLNTFAVCNK